MILSRVDDLENMGLTPYHQYAFNGMETFTLPYSRSASWLILTHYLFSMTSVLQCLHMLIAKNILLTASVSKHNNKKKNSSNNKMKLTWV